MILVYGDNHLAHYGVKGMRWGVRNAETRARYARNGGIRAKIAKRQNEKVRKSFEQWKQSDAAKAEAIAKGKKANDSRLALDKDPKNKALKEQYKADKKEYKQALKKNTTYRKGSVKEVVLRDSAHKNLVESKKVEKQLKSDPNNKNLQKTLTRLQDRHDIDLAKGRRAQRVAANRSQAIANLKRARTMAVKAAATSAAISVGVYAINKYSNVNVSTANVTQAVSTAKKILQLSKFL